MDIRKVDNKGRITAGEKGKHYYVEPGLNGAITLKPVPDIHIEINQPLVFSSEEMARNLSEVISRGEEG